MSDQANNDPISSALGMNPLVKDGIVHDMLVQAHDDSATKDFDYARSNIYRVIETGMEAMQNLGQIADQSQHPRAYEVVATVMKTILDANKDLMDIQKSIRQLNDADRPVGSQAKTINNNMFVGSTAELQKMIADMKNG